MLRDPRWQKLRLEILQRDNFTCRKCKSKDKTLHVHHVAYFKDQEPWEYHPDFLLTFCFECHEEEASGEEKGVIATLCSLGYLQEDFYKLRCFIGHNEKTFTDILSNLREWNI